MLIIYYIGTYGANKPSPTIGEYSKFNITILARHLVSQNKLTKNFDLDVLDFKLNLKWKKIIF